MAYTGPKPTRPAHDAPEDVWLQYEYDVARYLRRWVPEDDNPQRPWSPSALRNLLTTEAM